MMETYYVGTYWGARQESAEDCARRTQTLLTMLAGVDPLYARWFKTARTRKQALQRPLETGLSSLERYIQGNILRDDMRKPMRDAGFSVWLWNGCSGAQDVGLHFYCGSASPRLSNSCVLNPPDEGPSAERVLSSAALSQALRAMAMAWDPDWGVAMSHLHRELEQPQRVGRNPYVGWVTYLSRRLGTVPPLPAPVRVEPVEELGMLVVLTPERFTARNPDHVALAAHVREVLAGAGLLRH